jgi:hypothetical protein
VDSTGSGHGLVWGPCELGNEPPDSIKGRAFHGQLGDYKLLRENYIPCSCTRVYPKVSGLSHNEINNNNNNKHSLRRSTKGYGGKTH